LPTISSIVAVAALAQPEALPSVRGAAVATTTAPFTPASPQWMCAATVGKVTFSTRSR